MNETSGTVPESKPTLEKVEISSLTLNQRQLLKGGFKSDFLEQPAFNYLGNQQKTIFYTTCDMMINDKSINYLNLDGEIYEKPVDVIEDGKKKKKKQKFYRFRFAFVIPGTSNKLEVEKEWRYEDFPE